MTDDNALQPVENRAAATLDNVNFPERIITIVAVPYEEPAQIEYRGRLWNEVFSRSAFSGLESRQKRVPVLAHFGLPGHQDHTGAHLVGKMARAFPNRPEGLVLDLKVSKTARGDEALELAADDALSPSVGYAVRGSDQVLDMRSMTRRINRAFLDHLALVSQQAYAGARLLSMRGASNAIQPVRPITPSLDEAVSDPIFDWVGKRFNRGDT